MSRGPFKSSSKDSFKITYKAFKEAFRSIYY